MRSVPVVAAAIILVFGLAVAPVAADPIHDAAKAGDVAEVKKLLASGVKVGAKEEERGWTPLHLATLEVAKVLLKAGAKVDARTTAGVTPLHTAAWTGRADVIKFLLSAGAAANAKDKDGRTPFDLAKDHDILKGTDVYRELREAQYD